MNTSLKCKHCHMNVHQRGDESFTNGAPMYRHDHNDSVWCELDGSSSKAAEVESVKRLGPRQQQDAENDAEAVHLWARRLRQEIEANDVAAAMETVRAMASVTGRIADTLSRAKAVTR